MFPTDLSEQIHQIALAAEQKLLAGGVQLAGNVVREVDLNKVMILPFTCSVALATQRPVAADNLCPSAVGVCLTDKFFGVNIKPDMWARIEDAEHVQAEPPEPLWRVDGCDLNKSTNDAIAAIEAIELRGEASSDNRIASKRSENRRSGIVRNDNDLTDVTDTIWPALKAKFQTALRSCFIVTENKINGTFTASCKHKPMQVWF